MALIGKNFVFIHVPRTGGIALRKYLKGTEHMHQHCRAIDVPEEIQRQKITFGFRRDRVDWLFSLYRYVKYSPEHYDKENTATFERYVNHYIEKTKTEPFNPGTDYYCKQMDYLDGCDVIFEYEKRHEAIKVVSDFAKVKIENKVFNASKGEHEPIPSHIRNLIYDNL